MSPKLQDRDQPMPLAETVCAAVELIHSATIDGPLAVVPTAALRRLEAALDEVFEPATLELRRDTLFTN